MNMSKNLLKGFAAIAMLCMVGAVFATPVALGDIGAYYYLKDSNNGLDGVKVGAKAAGAGAVVLGAGAAAASSSITAVATAGAVVATGGAALVVIGVGVAA